MAKNYSKPILAAHFSALLDSKAGSRLDHAKAMGVGDGTLGRIKYATGNPTVENLDQIANYFSTETWRLLTKPASAGFFVT